jgi:hypothetical protein
MARSVDEINNYMVNALVTNFASIGITIDPTLWSKRNMLRMFIYCIAIGQALLEQLMDVFMAAVESQVAIAAAASALWIQSKMFQFQYSGTNPQFVSLINDAPQYSVIDPTLRIITACSVTSTASSDVTVKVAKTVNGILTALAPLELSAAQGYATTIFTAGIEYDVQSNNPDQIYIQADLYFQGQYSATIQATTIAAITNWLQQQSVTNFDGKTKMSALEDLISSIPGMNDVVLKNVQARKDADLFTAGIILISNEQVVLRQYISDAGYIIPETTVGKTLIDSLNFISE